MNYKQYKRDQEEEGKRLERAAEEEEQANAELSEDLESQIERDRKYNSRFRHDLTGQDEEVFNED